MSDQPEKIRQNQVGFCKFAARDDTVVIEPKRTSTIVMAKCSILSRQQSNALRVSRREYELTDDGTARDASRLHALVRPPRYPYPCRLLNRPSGHAAGGPFLPVAKTAGSLDAPSRICERVSHLYSSSCSSYHLFVSFSVITQVA
jgi:hypothetical protein